MKLSSLLLFFALCIGASPASAIEQNYRFFQSKAEREACYSRQEAELATKRAAQQGTDNRRLEAMQQMRQDDAEVYRSLRSICRGC